MEIMHLETYNGIDIRVEDEFETCSHPDCDYCIIEHDEAREVLFQDLLNHVGGPDSVAKIALTMVNQDVGGIFEYGAEILKMAAEDEVEETPRETFHETLNSTYGGEMINGDWYCHYNNHVYEVRNSD